MTVEFYSGKVLYPAIGILLALSTLFGLAILPRFSAGGSGLTGQMAPDVTLPVVANGDAGARMQISQLRGKPVVLDFWASWCGPCTMQAPILDRVARRYEKKGLVVLGINVDEPANLARAFAMKKGLSYPILVDDEGLASRGFGIDKLPGLVVIDKEGRVIAQLSGLVDEDSLEELVAASM